MAHPDKAPTPFEKFQEAVKRVLAAPKDEVDRKLAERKAKAAKRPDQPVEK